MALVHDNKGSQLMRCISVKEPGAKVSPAKSKGKAWSASCSLSGRLDGFRLYKSLWCKVAREKAEFPPPSLAFPPLPFFW